MKNKELLKILNKQSDWAHDKRTNECKDQPIGSGVFRYWSGYIFGLEFCIELLETLGK